MTRLGADILLVMHFLWVVFIITGFPLAWRLRSRVLRAVHLGGLLFYLVLAAVGAFCPLTRLEETLRRAQDPDFSYQGSFLAAWAERIIYVEHWGAPLWLFHVLAAAYLVVILATWRRFPRSRRG